MAVQEQGITGETWDARAELALAGFIRRYLRDEPPPDGSKVAGDLADYARLLEADGEDRLRRWQARPFVALSDNFDRARAILDAGREGREGA